MAQRESFLKIKTFCLQENHIFVKSLCHPLHVARLVLFTSLSQSFVFNSCSNSVFLSFSCACEHYSWAWHASHSFLQCADISSFKNTLWIFLHQFDINPPPFQPKIFYYFLQSEVFKNFKWKIPRPRPATISQERKHLQLLGSFGQMLK